MDIDGHEQDKLNNKKLYLKKRKKLQQVDEAVDLQETLEIGAEILEIHVKEIQVKNYQFDIKYLEIGNF
jgi:hypothetical protein